MARRHISIRPVFHKGVAIWANAPAASSRGFRKWSGLEEKTTIKNRACPLSPDYRRIVVEHFFAHSRGERRATRNLRPGHEQGGDNARRRRIATRRSVDEKFSTPFLSPPKSCRARIRDLALPAALRAGAQVVAARGAETNPRVARPQGHDQPGDWRDGKEQDQHPET
jgi:hypothetical protein